VISTPEKLNDVQYCLKMGGKGQSTFFHVDIVEVYLQNLIELILVLGFVKLVIIIVSCLIITSELLRVDLTLSLKQSGAKLNFFIISRLLKVICRWKTAEVFWDWSQMKCTISSKRNE
jgi:hypothetical protein